MQRQPLLRVFAFMLCALAFVSFACASPMAAPAMPAAEAPAAAEMAPFDGYAAQMAELPAGTDLSGGEQPVDMFFQDYGVRGFVEAAKDNLSTFSVDVDTGSYSVARAYVQDGFLPPPEAIRTEEFINYFDYDYPNPEAEETFNITLDAAPSPYFDESEHRLMRVGIQGYAVPEDQRPNANLTFVIDVSGSMDQDNRLGLAKRALYLLVDELRPTDQVAIVVYGDRADLIQEMLPASEKSEILASINRLTPEGSTNAAEGIELGYEVAARNFDPEAINRVVLLSDGVANVGVTGPEAILATIKEQAEQGIAMTTIGMGMDNYNDVLMEQLADDGNGFYAYVDTLDEAERVFVDKLTSTLLTIAEDAKIQVEFNPETVEAYRLMGYENRKVKDEDFREDVDAGEVGSGHSVTALYEVVMKEGELDVEAPVATARLRWTQPGTGEAIEIERVLRIADVSADYQEAGLDLQLAAAVSEYAEVLRQTEHGANTWLGDVGEEVDRIADAMEEEGFDAADAKELGQLIWLAEGMMPPHPASLED